MFLNKIILFPQWANILSRVPAVRLLSERTLHDHVNYAMPELEEVGAQPEKKTKWLTYNDKIFPPQSKEEARRPAYVCHWRENIKYSPKKLWYIACLIRGMSIEEALKQIDFVQKKGAIAVKETLLEARDLAVKEHNVEFASNLWVAESFVGKGHVVKGIRRHARVRMGQVEYKYSHYYVRLEEGSPPAQYYPLPPSDKASLLQKYLQEMRNRHVHYSL